MQVSSFRETLTDITNRKAMLNDELVDENDEILH
jgi:hypothetical protein